MSEDQSKAPAGTSASIMMANSIALEEKQRAEQELQEQAEMQLQEQIKEQKQQKKQLFENAAALQKNEESKQIVAVEAPIDDDEVIPTNSDFPSDADPDVQPRTSKKIKTNFEIALMSAPIENNE